MRNQMARLNGVPRSTHTTAENQNARDEMGDRTQNTRLREVSLRQPQDGAAEPTRRLADVDLRPVRLLSHEPDDARLTGATRSLARRLMGLIVCSEPARPAEPVRMLVQNALAPTVGHLTRKLRPAPAPASAA